MRNNFLIYALKSIVIAYNSGHKNHRAIFLWLAYRKLLIAMHDKRYQTYLLSK